MARRRRRSWWVEVGSEVLRGSEGNRAPKGDTKDDSVVIGAGSDLDLSEVITEGSLAASTTAEESSMESLASATPPVDNSKSVLFCKTRDWWVGGDRSAPSTAKDVVDVGL